MKIIEFLVINVSIVRILLNAPECRTPLLILEDKSSAWSSDDSVQVDNEQSYCSDASSRAN